MPRPVHFEVNADDPERAAEFYKRVFGWKVNKNHGPMEYWMVDTGPAKTGINGGIMHRNHAQGTINTIQVDSFDDTAKKIEDSGGRPITQKRDVPHVGIHAYFEDTEGNVFGVLQPPKHRQPAKESKKKRR